MNGILYALGMLTDNRTCIHGLGFALFSSLAFACTSQPASIDTVESDFLGDTEIAIEPDDPAELAEAQGDDSAEPDAAQDDGLAELATAQGGEVGVVPDASLDDDDLDWELEYDPITDFSWFGYGACWTSDIDGDGWRDIAVPDQDYSGGRGAKPVGGLVFMLSGKDGHLIHTWHLSEQMPDGTPGPWTSAEAIASSADLDDDDGVDEIFVMGYVALSEEESAPFLRAMSPTTGEVLWEQTDVPNIGWFGRLKDGHDFDGDGVLDLLFHGETRFGDSFRLSIPSMHIFSGATGEVLFQRDLNSEPYPEVGGVCSVPDLDGDGLPEYAIGITRRVPGVLQDGLPSHAIGIPLPDDMYVWESVVEVCSIQQAEPLLTLRTPDEDGVFAFSMQAADLTGDGRPELAVALSGDSGSICVFELSKGELLNRIVIYELWDNGSLDPYPGHIALRRRSKEVSKPGKAKMKRLGETFPDTDWLLTLADESSWTSSLTAYSLKTGEGLWHLGEQFGANDGKSSDPITGETFFAIHLGSELAIDRERDDAGRLSGFAGDMNHVYFAVEKAIWCFDVDTGELRFIKRALDVHKEAGLFYE